MRLPRALVAALVGLFGACANQHAPLQSLTGSSTTGSGTTGSITGASSTSTSAGGSTTGGLRFSCNLDDGGLFAVPLTFHTDAGPSPGNGLNFPLAVGDFDGDGNLDIALAYPGPIPDQGPGAIGIFFGNGDGSFGPLVRYEGVFGVPANVLTTRMVSLAQTYPFDAGALRLIVALVVVDFRDPIHGSGQLAVASISASRTLSVVASLPLTITDYGDGVTSIADLNGDGIPDFLVGAEQNMNAVINVFLSNTHDGGWNESGFVPFWAYNNNFAGDFNEDGIPDIVVQPPMGSQAPLHLLIGSSNGTFTDRGVIGSPDAGIVFSFVLGDINEDGHLDILVDYGWFGGMDSWVVLLGRGDGTFVDGPTVTLGIGTPIALYDLNGDGHLDFIGVGQLPYRYGTIRVALGNGDGTFQPWLDFPADGGVRDIAIGDVNNDGRPDLVGSDSLSQSVSVFLNSCR